MKKSKLNEKDKNVITITLIIGFVIQFFIESGMDIAILCSFIYFFHKYIGTTENIREYDSYEFRYKERYNRGNKLFVYLVDICIVIRIIFIILNKQTAFALNEILLIIMIYIPYEMYLNEKYVINTNILEEEKKVVFARRKILLSIGMIVFIVFSIFTIDTFKDISTETNVKYGKYEYNLNNIENRRKIEVKSMDSYIMAEESNENSKYFDTFIENAKSLMKKQVLKSYLFVSMLLFIILCLIEAHPKTQNIISIAGTILFTIALIFSILSFNIDINKEEMNLSSYFHEYMSR